MEKEKQTVTNRRIMKDLEKKLKMSLLEKLMTEMDDQSIKRVKKDEPSVEVTEIEHEEMPMSELEEIMTEKMSAQDEEEPELESEEEDEDDYESDFMKRVKAAKSKKLLE